MQPNKAPIVPITEVKGSSAVTGTGYDASKGILAVQFKGGRTYHYQGVPQETVAAMNSAESIGKFVNSNITGKFEQYKEQE